MDGSSPRNTRDTTVTVVLHMLPQTATSQMDSQNYWEIEVPPNGEGLRMVKVQTNAEEEC
jgi:hypothetical protein